MSFNFSSTAFPSILLLFLCIGESFSQTWEKTFNDTIYTDWANAVELTSDGNYMVATTTYPNVSTGYDIGLIKLDQNGDTLWTRNYHKGQADYWPLLQETFDGGFVITGVTSSTATLNQNAQDIYLIRVNADGDTLWTKTYGGPEDAHASDIRQMPDSGFIIVNNQHQTNDKMDLYFIRTDKSGNVLWTNSYGEFGTEERATLGGITFDNGLIMAGPLFYGASLDSSNILLIKTDINADTLWTRRLGGDTINIYAEDVLEASDSSLVILADAYTPFWDTVIIYLIKTDPSGTVLWSKALSFGAYNYGYELKQTSDGGFIIAAAVDGAALLIKTDQNGDLVWAMEYAANMGSTFRSVQETTDGGYIAAGYTYVYDSIAMTNDQMVYVIKTDAVGCIYSIADFTSDSSIIEMGDTVNFQDLSNTWLTDTITSWYWDFGDGDTSNMQNPSHVYLIPDTFLVTLIVTNNYGCKDTISKIDFILVEDTVTIFVNEVPDQDYHISLFPNPCTSTCTITLEGLENSNDCALIMYDLIGKEVLREGLSSNNKHQINRDGLKNGLYFYKLFTDQVIIGMGKLILN